MTVFNGVDQYIKIDNGPVNVNYWVYLTLSSDYPAFTGSSRYIYDGRFGIGESYCYSPASSDTVQRWDLQNVRVDGVGTSNVLNPTTCPSGSVLGFQVVGSAENTGEFTLLSRFDATQLLALSVDKVEIYANDNVTLIHSFDLLNPTSANITDSVGSANLTLYGFTFGPTINNITNPITTGDNATLTGNFPGATLGNTTVTQDGVALTVVSANETTIVVTTVDVESSSLKYGTHTFEVTIV